MLIVVEHVGIMPGGIYMADRSKLHYNNRVEQLRRKDPVANAKIIAKAKRRLFKCE